MSLERSTSSVQSSDSLAGILHTDELARRPKRAPRFEEENRVLIELLGAMELSSDLVLQKVADAALHLTNADSAGVSLLESDCGRDIFRWRATSGEFAPLIQSTMPREFSPCGTVLDCNAKQLMVWPVRHFPYIAQITQAVCELLLIPFYEGDTPIGTVWVVSHSPEKKFDSEDARSIESIARFAAVAVRRVRVLEELTQANDRLRADDSKLQKSLAAIDEAREQAEAANRQKERFFAVLSHELRTPLTPALMTATAMQMDESLSASAREDAAMIRRNIEMETRLIDDLLDVSRVNAGKVELRQEQCGIHKLLHECVSGCREASKSKAVRIELQLGATHNHVNGDVVRLRQVFSNLLSNAIKFTPTGGAIDVVTSDEADKITVDVRDTGRGIDPALLARVFDAFEQGGRAVTQQFEGMGLGLAIAKGFVEAHGGQIRADSKGVGFGTTMTVILPTVAQPASATVAAPSTPSAEAAGELNILLVEDHEDSLKVMSRLLRKLNYRVSTATTVGAALTIADRFNFDLLISDVGLPDGSGLDLMRQLRAGRDIHGIALTGYGEASDIAEAMDAGFRLHLTKPIRFEELEDAVKRFAMNKCAASLRTF